MKKFLAILAVAGVMTACNNGTDETPVADSISQDSINAATPVMIDSTATGDSATTGTDTTTSK